MGITQSTVSALRARFNALFRKSFVRSVGVLAGGTAAAQAVIVLTLPMLTRLYTPEDFTVLAVYAAMLGIVAIAACLRLEIAIPLPSRDEDAANLLALSLIFAAVTAATTGIVVWLFAENILRLIDQAPLGPYLWLLPLGVWLASSYSALQFWATRKSNFSTISRTRVVQAIGGSGVQVGFGWAGIAPFGLLLGHMIGSGAGVFGLSRKILKNDSAAFHSIRPTNMLRLLREYDRFPKYSTFEALANILGLQLPLIIIAALAIGPEAGFLMLAMRAMKAPMDLIGGAVAQVYLSRAPEELRNRNLGKFTNEVLAGLLKVGVGPILFAAFVAPPVFSFVFGEQWIRAGEIVVWMTPWLIFQFLSSPISMVMHIRNRQRTMLAVTIIGLLLRLAAIGFAGRYDQLHFVEYFAISGGIFYIFCYGVFTQIANVTLRDSARTWWRMAIPLSARLGLGIACSALLERLDL